MSKRARTPGRWRWRPPTSLRALRIVPRAAFGILPRAAFGIVPRAAFARPYVMMWVMFTGAFRYSFVFGNLGLITREVVVTMRFFVMVHACPEVRVTDRRATSGSFLAGNASHAGRR